MAFGGARAPIVEGFAASASDVALDWRVTTGRLGVGARRRATTHVIARSVTTLLHRRHVGFKVLDETYGFAVSHVVDFVLFEDQGHAFFSRARAI